MDQASLLTFATAMFTILNPFGNVAVFASMVANRSAEDCRRIAIRCAIAIAIILVGTIWLGEAVLHFFGVDIDSLKIAGGIMIGSIALSMLNSNQSTIHNTQHSDQAKSPDQDIAIVPLAMPMVAGPGAIVTVLVSTHGHTGIIANLEMSLVCVALAALIGVEFLFVKRIIRLFGRKGMDIVTKFMGMVLLAIASGMLAEGAKALLPGLSG